MSMVDKNLCITCGLCFGVHGDLFALWADGKAEATRQPVGQEDMDNFEDAMVSCPVAAISAATVELAPEAEVTSPEAPVIPMQTSPEAEAPAQAA